MKGEILPPKAIPVFEAPAPVYYGQERPLAKDQTVTRWIDSHAPSLEGTLLMITSVLVYAFRRRLRNVLSWLRK